MKTRQQFLNEIDTEKKAKLAENGLKPIVRLEKTVNRVSLYVEDTVPETMETKFGTRYKFQANGGNEILLAGNQLTEQILRASGTQSGWLTFFITKVKKPLANGGEYTEYSAELSTEGTA